MEIQNDQLHIQNIQPIISHRHTKGMEAGILFQIQFVESNFLFLIRIVGGGIQAGSTRHVGH
jgi:hypothetical protein